MKFLKRFFEYIKNIIKKDKLETGEDNLQQLSNQTPIIEDYEYSYNQIEIGDIIWGKRYANEAEKENIPEGHRKGPFIVLARQDGHLFCAQGSSIPPYENYSNVYFCIDSLEYDLKKVTYFNLIKLIQIDEFSFIRKIDELKENELNNLYRNIKKNHKTYYNEESKIIKLNIPILMGDIINVKNKNYIVIDQDKDKFICLCLNKEINFSKVSQLNVNNFDELDYSNIITIDNNENIKYINSVSDNIIKYILKQQKEELINNKNQSITQRGTVILKENTYYYIYGEESSYWLVFELSKDYIKQSEKIEIGSVYYTKYNDSKINKNDQYTNIFTCKEIDKDRIKHLRKSYKEAKKNESIYGSLEVPYFKIGDIIENINYKNKRYIIVNMHKKTYECLNIDDIKNAIYNPILIRKIDSKYAKNTSTHGIKWLEEHKRFNLKAIGDTNILNLIFIKQKEYLKEKEMNEKIDNISKIMNIEQTSNYIELNSIIKKDGFSDEKFIVKDILGDMLVCISMVESGKINPRKYYFNKNSVIFINNKQKRK